jgi:alkylhydroperoxidase family enzyme
MNSVMKLSRGEASMIALEKVFSYSRGFPKERPMPRLNEPRLPPIDPNDFNEEQREVYKNQIEQGSVLNIFRTLAHHPKLAKRWGVFGTHILNKSTLSPRDREIAILRIGWLCQAEYEWGQHVVIGKAAGLSLKEIERIKEGTDADGWTDAEKLIIRATDELKDDAFITDETWKALTGHYSDQQLMDLVFTVGQYNLVSMALNTLGVQLDKDIPGF